LSQVKGVAIRGLLKSVKERGWPVGDVVAGLPEPARASFVRSIVASTWYPYPVLTGLLETIERLHGEGGFALTRAFGARAAQRDLGTTFKIITAIASLEFFLKRAQVFWAQYCDTGQLLLERYSADGFVLRLDGFPAIHPGHCTLIEGWLEGIAIALGAEGDQCRQTLCVQRGDPRCEFTSTWVRLGGIFRT
jgi:hypothetical protein